jgi:hypothetical protein
MPPANTGVGLLLLVNFTFLSALSGTDGNEEIGQVLPKEIN